MLFNKTESKATGRTNHEFTAVLTRMSNEYALQVLDAIADNEDEYRELVEESRTNSNLLADIIEKSKVLEGESFDEYELDNEEAIKIMKSQQSKRSRLKSKGTETFEGYKTYLSAFIGETIIRTIADIKRASSGPRGRFSYEPYTEEELIEFKENQHRLASALRNLQSRKCILKKEDSEEAAAKIEQLIIKEDQLKQHRDSSQLTSKSQFYTKIVEHMEAIGDISELKVKEAREALQVIASIIDEV